MATARKAAPAAAPAAPAVKKAAAAPKPAAKPVAAPPPAEEEVGPELAEGMNVKFLGYAEGTPANQQILEMDGIYPIIGFTEADPEADPPYEGGDPIVRCANPDFDSKKRENAETNPKELEIQVFANELEVVAEEPEPAPAPAPVKGKKAAAAAAPAAAGKGKKVAAAPKVKEPKPEPVPVDPDAVPDLTTEDAAVLEMVNGAEDLVGLAQELASTSATSEFQLGGVLYHIRKNKAHRTMLGDDGQPIKAYSEKGGWEAFITDYFSIDYRKAQWLQEIYVHFSLAGITDASERVAEMGWTKAKTIAKALSMEGAKVEDILQLAAENTTKDLATAVHDIVHVGGTKGTPKKRLTLRFRYLEEEAAAINAILTAAVDVLGVKNMDEAVEKIVTEWGANNAGGIAKVGAAPKQSGAPAAKRVAVKKVAATA